MAEAVLTDSKLSITFEVGPNDEGKMQYKAKNYSNVKTSSTTDGLFAAANAIVGLQGNVLDSIERKDSTVLTA